jgi:flagellar protein FlaF
MSNTKGKTMSLAGYTVAQTTEDPRKTEYRIFAQVTRALMEVTGSNALDFKYRDAIEWNRRLWNALEIDLSSERNQLPDSLKAQIISVAMWVERHSALALRGEGRVEPLITVNRAIMEGLTAPAAPATVSPAAIRATAA